MLLTPAEKQRRYRERRKSNPEKDAESKRKDRERYHANKRLVRDLTTREHRAIKKKWRSANARRKDKSAPCCYVHPRAITSRLNSPDAPSLDQIIPNADRRLFTPQLSTSRGNTPNPITLAASRGRKQVKRNRSKLFRDNIKLKEQLEPINKSYQKFKKRYNREKRKESKIEADYKFIKVIWNFFEAGHGKGAADGIGDFLKRTADQLVARGRDISDATNFYFSLKDVSKVRLHLITNENIEQRSNLIPEHIVPLLGTMKVHQVFTEEAGVLKYRNLSCFCQRGFCSCMEPKHYIPLKKLKTLVEQSTNSTCDSNYLSDISNLCQKRPKGFYNIVYSSDSDDDALLISLKEKPSSTYLSEQPGTSKQNEDALVEKENIHVNKIKLGVVKISTLKQDYVYLGKALSEVEEDGEVKIMFFKSIDYTATKFKLVESDLSYVSFDNFLAIVPEPKKVCTGKRIY